MRFYHGTTMRSAIKIAEMGFLPRKGAVWFTTSKQYAQGRAKQKARRTAAHRLSSPVKLMSQNYITALEKIWLCVAGELLPSGGVFHGQ